MRTYRNIAIAAALCMAGTMQITGSAAKNAQTEVITEQQEDEAVTAEQLGLSDGSYTAEGSLEGGSGRASITSPVSLTIKEGKITASIEFSSPYYDYIQMAILHLRFRLPDLTQQFR